LVGIKKKREEGDYVLFYYEYFVILKGDISTPLRFAQYDVVKRRWIASYAWCITLFDESSHFVQLDESLRLVGM